MTVSQLIEALSRMPTDAVVLIDSGGGLSAVSALDFVAGHGPAESSRSDPASEYE